MSVAESERQRFGFVERLEVPPVAQALFDHVRWSCPILLVIAVLLIMAWKTAGWWGLDRWVLPALGTPWSPGPVFRDREKEPATS